MGVGVGGRVRGRCVAGGLPGEALTLTLALALALALTLARPAPC